MGIRIWAYIWAYIYMGRNYNHTQSTRGGIVGSPAPTSTRVQSQHRSPLHRTREITGIKKHTHKNIPQNKVLWYCKWFTPLATRRHSPYKHQPDHWSHWGGEDYFPFSHICIMPYTHTSACPSGSWAQESRPRTGSRSGSSVDRRVSSAPRRRTPRGGGVSLYPRIDPVKKNIYNKTKQNKTKTPSYKIIYIHE